MYKEEKISVLETAKREGEECLSYLFEAKKNGYKSYFATLILSSDEIIQRSKIDWEYKSLTHLIEEEFVMHKHAYTWFSDFKDIKAQDKWHGRARSDFGELLRRRLWDIAEGLIFYVKEGEVFRQANPTDGHYNLALHLITGPESAFRVSPPSPWVDTLFVNAKNLYAHKLVWNNPEDEDPALKKSKCEAVWRETERLSGMLVSTAYEGTPETKPTPLNRWPWGSYTTRNLEHLEAATKQFWVLYDPSDPTTAPTNARVIEWLRTKRGVTTATAEKIASILRDEKLPTGPRK